jgi:acetolactate synthase small subunit
MAQKIIRIETVNSPTILQRIIQTIKRRRINIHQFTAREKDGDTGHVEVVVDADTEQVRLLTAQIERQVDVIKVN